MKIGPTNEDGVLFQKTISTLTGVAIPTMEVVSSGFPAWVIQRSVYPNVQTRSRPKIAIHRNLPDIGNVKTQTGSCTAIFWATISARPPA
jgi:hypothetical protein